MSYIIGSCHDHVSDNTCCIDQLVYICVYMSISGFDNTLIFEISIRKMRVFNHASYDTQQYALKYALSPKLHVLGLSRLL